MRSRLLARRAYRGSKLMSLAAAALALGSAAQARATIIFSDDFTTGSDSVDATSTPGGNGILDGGYTSYDVASSKSQTSTMPGIDSDTLQLGLSSTSSGVVEAQAVFTGTPVQLVNPGDTIDMQVLFVDTAALNNGGASTQVSFGLYNSGGVLPYSTLLSSGLCSANTNDSTGGTKNWLGYFNQMFAGANNNYIVGRVAQTGTTNTVQDLIGNNASSSSTYPTVDPTANPLLNGGEPTALTTGDQYLEDLNISLNGSGLETITGTLTNETTSSAVSSVTGTLTTNLTTEFDSLAIGWRETNSIATQMNVDSINITFTSVPEPTSMGLMLLGGGTLLARRRKATKVIA
jgi:hypothetical protein